MSRTWTRITATLPSVPPDWSAWDEIFESEGLNGTVQTDKPPTIGGYAYQPELETLARLTERLKEFGAVQVEVAEEPEQDWDAVWKSFFKPRRIGKGWIVRPTWEEFEAQPEDRVLVLDPGQAFGTGDHPTTRMCLALMEGVDFAGKDVIDVGCGSGILSVGAVMLGAARVRGNDIEKASVETAEENAARNGVEVEFFVGKGFEPYEVDIKADIVLSNIISAALIHLSPEAASVVRPGGTWLVSGIIDQNWPDVLAAAERVGFVLQTHEQEDQWIAARFLR